MRQFGFMRCEVWEVPQKLNMWYICIKSRIHHPNFVRVPEVVRCMHWWNSESLRSMKIESWGISRRLNAWFVLQKVSHSDIVLWAPISSLAGHIVMIFFKKNVLGSMEITIWLPMAGWVHQHQMGDYVKLAASGHDNNIASSNRLSVYRMLL